MLKAKIQFFLYISPGLVVFFSIAWAEYSASHNYTTTCLLIAFLTLVFQCFGSTSFVLNISFIVFLKDFFFVSRVLFLFSIGSEIISKSNLIEIEILSNNNIEISNNNI